jgi:protein-disulfide isomerase
MDDRSNTSSRRDQAREKARALREEHRKEERRRRTRLQFIIGAAIIVVAALIAYTLISSQGGSDSGPLNMASDGIVIGKDFKAERTPALASNENPIATPRDKKSSVVSIRIYLDYFCPVCNAFETANKGQLSSWLKSGAITLEIHPISILDRSSLGTRYSSRAANAAACVANYAPDDYWAFTQEMYAKQPREGTGGLSNSQIVDVMNDAGVHSMSKITPCVMTEKFKDWVLASTDRALTGPLPDSNAKKVLGTPTIIVDGQSYPVTSTDVSSAAAFAAFVEQAAGSQFDSGGSTPSPTPTPTSIPIPLPTPTKKP